jgi:serine/threonine protein kinase
MAPEVWQRGGYDLSADVYSMKIVFWEIFAREVPPNERKADHSVDIDLNKLAALGTGICKLVQDCLAIYPEERP